MCSSQCARVTWHGWRARTIADALLSPASLLSSLSIFPAQLSNADNTCATLVVMGEDHTLGNAFRYVLAKNKEVDFVGYSIPHPSEMKMNMRVQTKSQSDTAQSHRIATTVAWRILLRNRGSTASTHDHSCMRWGQCVAMTGLRSGGQIAHAHRSALRLSLPVSVHDLQLLASAMCWLSLHRPCRTSATTSSTRSMRPSSGTSSSRGRARWRTKTAHPSAALCYHLLLSPSRIQRAGADIVSAGCVVATRLVLLLYAQRTSNFPLLFLSSPSPGAIFWRYRTRHWSDQSVQV